MEQYSHVQRKKMVMNLKRSRRCCCLLLTLQRSLLGKTSSVAYRICLAVAYCCTPRVRHHWYRPTHGVQIVRHGCVLYPWRTGLYASGVFRSSGVRSCMPLTCTPLNFFFCTPRLRFFKKKFIVILPVYCR
jgi:hypothetical protein